ncbi:unnamed protein product [Thelazia callipaeda]|uniref:SAE2 domain-containing protein n=1 Tax=Thelazia callipaeda TaxID=103827 RepID=A0A0N5CU10_THECL|nr:unnamed protein product [Thelazia callipaeda]
MDSSLRSYISTDSSSTSRHSAGSEFNSQCTEDYSLDVTLPPSFSNHTDKSSQITEFPIDIENGEAIFQKGLRMDFKGKENSSGIFDGTNHTLTPPKSSQSCKMVILETQKGSSPNRSPLLPTQPPLSQKFSSSAEQELSIRSHHTLDNWLIPLKSQARKQSVNKSNNTLDAWLMKSGAQAKSRSNNANGSERIREINSDSPLKKTDFEEFCSPVRKARRLPMKKVSKLTTSNMKKKNRQECLNEYSLALRSTGNLETSSQVLSDFQICRAKKYNKLSSGIVVSSDETHLKNSSQELSSKHTMIETSILSDQTLSPECEIVHERRNSESDLFSSLSTDSFLSSAPSPRKPSQDSVLKKVSLADALRGSSVVSNFFKSSESQHTRSLLKVMSSPTFQQVDRKYEVNELSSRFNDHGQVRRKKSERQLLHGFDCPCCTDYYEALGLDEDERNKRIDQVSKHRDAVKEPTTPEHYWEVNMPNREEQRRRGQIIESDSPIGLKTRYPQYKGEESARRRLFN